MEKDLKVLTITLIIIFVFGVLVFIFSNNETVTVTKIERNDKGTLDTVSVVITQTF